MSGAQKAFKVLSIVVLVVGVASLVVGIAFALVAIADGVMAVLAGGQGARIANTPRRAKSARPWAIALTCVGAGTCAISLAQSGGQVGVAAVVGIVCAVAGLVQLVCANRAFNEAADRV